MIGEFNIGKRDNKCHQFIIIILISIWIFQYILMIFQKCNIIFLPFEDSLWCAAMNCCFVYVLPSSNEHVHSLRSHSYIISVVTFKYNRSNILSRREKRGTARQFRLKTWRWYHLHNLRKTIDHDSRKYNSIMSMWCLSWRNDGFQEL